MKSPSACPFSFQFVSLMNLAIPSLIFVARSSQLNVSVNDFKLSNAPFSKPESASAMVFMSIFSIAPFKAFPSAVPSLPHPVIPAPSF